MISSGHQWDDEIGSSIRHTPKEILILTITIMRIPLWNPGRTTERFQYPRGAKTSKNRNTEEDKKNSFTLPMSPLSQGNTAQTKRDSPWPATSPIGKVKTKWTLGSPALREGVQESHFHLSTPRTLRGLK